MTRPRPAPLVAALVVAASVSLSGCSGLEFVQDQRLTFTSPAANKLTRTPVTLSWSIKDYQQGQGEYAVFVDQAPLKVGKTLLSLLPARTAPAAEAALLKGKNIYTTTTPSITLTLIPDIDNDSNKRQRHMVTVVLLDAAGKRTTESAWTRSFDLTALDNTN